MLAWAFDTGIWVKGEVVGFGRSFVRVDYHPLFWLRTKLKHDWFNVSASASQDVPGGREVSLLSRTLRT